MAGHGQGRQPRLFNFIQTLTPNYPFWNMRTAGGIIFFAGFLVFVYNIYKTIQTAPAAQKA